jgi:hypothetical protein
MALSSSQISFEPVLMQFSHHLRHEHSHRFTDDLDRVIAKDALRGGIRQEDSAPFIHADHCVVGCFNNHAMLFFDTSQIFLGVLAVGNLLSQLFVGRGKFCSSLRDASIEFARDPLLLAPEASLLQPDGRLIRCYAQNESLGLLRKIFSL